jgi:hypothetical protein
MKDGNYFGNYEGPVVNIDIARIPRYKGTMVRMSPCEVLCDLSHRGSYASDWDRMYLSAWDRRIVRMEMFECVYLDKWTAWRVQVWMGQCPGCGRVYQTWECVWLPDDMKEVLDWHFKII